MAGFVVVVLGGSVLAPVGAGAQSSEPPGAPTLTVTAGDSQALLSWTAPSGPITGWHYSYDEGFIWRLAPGGASARSYRVTGLANGTQHKFVVRAVNSAGAGAASNVVTAAPAAEASAPAAATGLAAAAGDTLVRLSWTAPASGADVVSWEVSSDNGASWSAISGSRPGTVSHTVTGLSNSTAYTFRVRARNTAGAGAASSSASATPAAASAAPAAPAGVRVSAGWHGELRVGWDAVSGARAYQLQRKVASAADSTYADCGSDIAAGVTRGACGGLSVGTDYRVRVRAKNAAGSGSWSAGVSGTAEALYVGWEGAPARSSRRYFTLPPGGSVKTVLAASRPPPAPFSIRFQGQPGLLDDTTWNLRPFGELKHPNGTKLSNNIDRVIHTATLTPAMHRIEYSYESLGKPYKGRHNWDWTLVNRPNTIVVPHSALSETVGLFAWARIIIPNTVPTAKAGPDLVVTQGETVMLNGSRSLNDAGVVCCPQTSSSSLSYEWSQKSGTNVAITDSDEAVATFTAPSVTTDTDLVFELKATDDTAAPGGKTNPGHSDTDRVTVTVRPSDAPAAVSVSTPGAPVLSVETGDASALLSWTAPVGSVTGWHYSTDNGFEWNVVPGRGSRRSFWATGLRNGRDHKFLVRAVNSAGAGTQSNTVGGVPAAAPEAPSAPGRLSALAGDGVAELSWSAPASGADVVAWQASSDDGSTWSAISGSGPDTASHIVTGLTNSTAYTFKVRARNSAGSGTASNSASATPAAASDEPPAPTGVTTTLGWSRELRVKWNSVPGATAYELERKVASAADSTYTQCGSDIAASLEPSGKCGSLTNGTSYKVRVRAKNTDGSGDWSTDSRFTTAAPQRLIGGYVRAPGQPIRYGGLLHRITPGGSVPLVAGLNRPPPETVAWRLQGGPGLQSKDVWLERSPFGRLVHANGSVFTNNGDTLLSTHHWQPLVRFTPAQPRQEYTYFSLNKPHKGEAEWELTNVDRHPQVEISRTGVFYPRARILFPETRPTARAGPDQTVDGGAVVTLDGSQSLNDAGVVCCPSPSTSSLAYSWTQKSGSTVVLTGADTARPTFTAPTLTSAATLKFELTVTDDTTPPWRKINPGFTSTDEVTVNVRASANAATDANLGSLTVSDSSLSPAFDPGTTTYTAKTGLTTVTVEAAARNPSASVSISPADADPDAGEIPGEPGHQVSLTRGSTTVVTITVTATNTTTTKVYTLNIASAAPGVVATPTRVSVPEGRTMDYTVRLAAKPTADVTVTVAKASGGDPHLSRQTSSRTFTTGNWDTPQWIRLAAAEDNDAANGTAVFTNTASSTDTGYQSSANVVTRVTAAEVDNDLPGLRIAAARPVREGHWGRTTRLVFPVTMAPSWGRAVNAEWSVSGGTATAGVDFAASSKSGRVHFAPGDTAAEIAVEVLGDPTVEPDETVVVTLTRAPGAQLLEASATGVISDDDTPVVLSVTPSTLVEGSTAEVTAHIRGAPTAATRVRVSIAAVDAEPSDLVQHGATLVIQPGVNPTSTGAVRLQSTQDVGGNDERFRVSATVVNTVDDLADPFPVDVLIVDDDAAPLAPTSLGAARGDARVVLSWTPASSGPPVMGYQYRYRRNDARHGNWRDYGAWLPVPGGGVNAYAVAGLAAGVDYTFEVRATNAFGQSRPSPEASVTAPAAALAPPGAPRGLAAAPGDGSVTLSWRPPAVGRAPASRWEYRVGGGSWTRVPGGLAHTTSHTVVGLTNGTRYVFRLRAANRAGTGPASKSASATPLPPPAAPSNLTAAPLNNAAQLAWTPPAGAVTGYEVRYNNSAWEAIPNSARARGHRLGGLYNGTAYSIEVRARNAAGASPASDTATVTPAAVPAAISGLAAVPSGRHVVLTWTALTRGGGGAAADRTGHEYRVRRYEAGGWGAWSDWRPAGGPYAGSLRVSGLTDGQRYGFELRAVNGPARGPIASVGATPRAGTAAPGAPTGLSADPGDASVSLSWSTPSGGVWSYEYWHSSSGGWQSMTNDGGATSHILTGLTNGIGYAFRIRARNGSGAGPHSNTVTATPRAAPNSPTGLTAAAGDTQVTLSWTAPAGGGPVHRYDYRQRAGSHAWGEWTDAGVGTATSVAVTRLANGTRYTFQVRAANTASAGTASSTVSATPQAPPTSAPTGLTATAGDKEATLAWTAPAGGVIEGYHVRSKAGTAAYTGWTSTGSTSTSFVVTGLANGTSHKFQVRAFNTGGTGPASSEATTTPAAAVNAPAAPTGLTAAAGNQRVTLAWTPPTGSITSYEVSQDNASTWAAVTDSNGSTRSHVVTGLSNGTEYTFKVRAKNTGGTGAASAAVKSTPLGAPAAPGALRATPGPARIALSWTAPAGPITGYQYRHKTTGAFGVWKPTPGAATSHTLTGLANGSLHTVEVRALSASGNGAAASATATPAAAPTGLTAAPGDASASLSWTAPTGSVTGYEYQRRPAAGAWTSWASTASGARTAAAVAGLTNGTEYLFRVRALYGTVTGPASGTASATPAAPPSTGVGAPTGLTAAAGPGSASLSWAAPAGAAPTGYQYRYKLTGSYSNWAPTTGTATTHTATGLTPEAVHTFQVRAVTATAVSEPSNTATATPSAAFAAPTTLTAHPTSDEIPDPANPANTLTVGAVQLVWTPPAGGVTAYEYRHRKDQGAYTTWKPATGLSAAEWVTNLSFNTTYTFQIRARSNDLISAPSNTASARPLRPLAAPTGLAATAGETQVALSWTAPSGDAPTGYQYRHTTQAPAADPRYWGRWTDAPGGAATSTVVTGLTNGVTYYFQVRSLNNDSRGAASTEASAAPAAATSAPDPTITLTAVPQMRHVTLNWTATAPSAGRSIAWWGYWTGDPATTNPVRIHGSDANTRTFTLTEDLNPGQQITIWLAAFNSQGHWPGLRSSRTVTTLRFLDIPAAPALTAAPGNGHVTLTWTTPATGTVTGYQYRIRAGSNHYCFNTPGECWINTNSTANTITISGLNNNTTYHFQLRAINTTQQGQTSNEATATPAPN